MKMSDHHSGSYIANGSGGSSRSSNWREIRYKRNEDRKRKWDGEYSSSREGSSQTYQLVSDVSEYEHRDRRDQELECLRRLVRDLELEAQGRRRRRNHDEHAERSASVVGSHREASCQSSSHQTRHRSWDYQPRLGITWEAKATECCYGRHKPSITQSSPISILERD